jgi:hypothetical protein
MLLFHHTKFESRYAETSAFDLFAFCPACDSQYWSESRNSHCASHDLASAKQGSIGDLRRRSFRLSKSADNRESRSTFSIGWHIEGRTCGEQRARGIDRRDEMKRGGLQ